MMKKIFLSWGGEGNNKEEDKEQEEGQEGENKDADGDVNMNQEEGGDSNTTTATAAAAVKEADLSADEIRRRRLARFNTPSQPVSPPQASPPPSTPAPKPTTTSSPTPSPTKPQTTTTTSTTPTAKPLTTTPTAPSQQTPSTTDKLSNLKIGAGSPPKVCCAPLLRNLMYLQKAKISPTPFDEADENLLERVFQISFSQPVCAISVELQLLTLNREQLSKISYILDHLLKSLKKTLISHIIVKCYDTPLTMLHRA